MPNYEIIPPYPTETSYDLYDDLVHHISLSGKGLPNIKRRIVKIVSVDGGVDDGYTIEPRRMQLKFAIKESSQSALNTKIDQIYEIFRPQQSELAMRLKVTRDDASVREILCHVDGTFEIDDEEYLGGTLKTIVVPLIAPNPIWYDPTQHTKNITIGSSGDTYSFTEYAGSWHEYPVLRVYGQIEDPGFIINFQKRYPGASSATNFQYIFYLSGTIPDSDYYDINLLPGIKTIYDSGGTNRLNTLSGSSDEFGEWRIEPDPYLTNFQLTYVSKNANADLDIIYYDRYIGI